ncbi:hypothetical protein ACSBR2_022285 [Camellia fascicularis]
MGTLILFLLLLSSSSRSLPFMTQASALFVFGDSTVDAGNNKIESCITEHFYPYGVDYNNQYTGRFTNGLTADFMASASFPALFVFGDSTVDAGNNNKIERGITANFYPYGVDYNNHSTGRFTNGLTAADFMGTLLTYYYNNQSIGRSATDFMAFSLVDVPPRPAYHNLTESDRKRTTIAMAGINYGSSGCGIFTTTRPLESECFNLEQQIDFFKETVQEDLPYLIPEPDARKQYLAKSVFFISMGANDYFFTYPESNTKDPNEFAISLIFELKIYLDILYEIGARQFIVNNIGPLGCLPSLRYKTISRQCNEDMNNLIMPYNYRLPKWLKTWTHYDYSGITFVLADSYGLLNHMVYHPQEFGFKDVKHPCCGQDVNGELECPPNATPCSNRDEYLFFDGAHTSQVANLEFALLCANATICRVIE